MVLIGLISDIHANLAALDAVLADMPGTDLLLCAGDLVGYYAEPNQVCERVRQAGAICVRGNHDAYVVGALEPDASRREAYRTDWTRQELTAENRAWLTSLPVEQGVTAGDLSIRVRHASPWDEETYLYPDSPRLDEIELGRDERLVVGHTHRPLVRPAGQGVIVNPGSVGQPRDWDPRPSYAILDVASRDIRVARVNYDYQAVQQRLAGLGWPETTIAILGRRRDAPVQRI